MTDYSHYRFKEVLDILTLEWKFTRGKLFLGAVLGSNDIVGAVEVGPGSSLRGYDCGARTYAIIKTSPRGLKVMFRYEDYEFIPVYVDVDTNLIVKADFITATLVGDEPVVRYYNSQEGGNDIE